MNNMRWMSRIRDNLKITQINMPGTHDSACCYVDFSIISKTQNLTVSDQLNVGVRYFDFRFKFDGTRFIANHSIVYCRKKFGFWNEVLTADDVVRDCIEFLRKNPSETILFQLKEAQSNAGTVFYTEFYKRYIESDRDLWFLENRIPALSEVRGKIILLRAVSVDADSFSDENSGINFTAYPYVDTYNIDDWKKGEIKTLSGDTYSFLYVQDSYKTEGMQKWGTVTRFLESDLSEDEFNICLTSCTRLRVPKINAMQINKLIKNYDFSKGKTYGVIAVDFAESEVCEKIIATNY